MAENSEGHGSTGWKVDEGRRRAYYSRLFRRFVSITLVCSLAPLLLVGWGINVHYTRIARERLANSFQMQVDYHRKMIDLFLKERSSKLHLVAQSHSREYLRQPGNLARLFEIMNQGHGSLTDLGLIGEEGRHLAYIGPYDLMDKNYRETLWFKKVMEKGLYISDMFLGFRKVPHFIIAIKRVENGEKWILRATVDTEAFRSMVENVSIGKTGEVYLVNEEGFLQTSPRLSGKIMGKSPTPVEPFFDGTKIRFLADGDYPVTGDKPQVQRIVATAWLKEPRWLLVVKQDYAEAFEDVSHANFATLIFLHMSALTILIVSIISIRYVVNVIKRGDREADQLNQQLMEAGKMASIGELSAGVAHEINNPLAIILTERQILLDLAGQTQGLDEGFREALHESLSQMDVQVKRCKRITQNLLRFARRTRSVVETVDLNAFLQEVVELMEREAQTSGIKFVADLDENLKPILSDPSQLQQVFLNLVTNAIDAHEGRPFGTIRIITRADDKRKRVNVVFSDTGSGIPKENMARIFDPFFTTKPVGKGTGLGLSICYAIVKRLGGEIALKSEAGMGTEFTIALPYRPPYEVQEGVEEEVSLRF